MSRSGTPAAVTCEDGAVLSKWRPTAPEQAPAEMRAREAEREDRRFGGGSGEAAAGDDGRPPGRGGLRARADHRDPLAGAAVLARPAQPPGGPMMPTVRAGGAGPEAKPHLSVAEARRAGASPAARCPLSHGHWTPAPHAATDRCPRGAGRRRDPGLVPIRYRHAHLALRVLPGRGGHHGRRPGADAAHRPPRQLLGDAHLSNFGLFASPERDLVFGVNDFDGRLPGPWDWDVKRLAASFAIAARERAGLDEAARRNLVLGTSPPTDVPCATSRRCAISMSGTRASTSPASSAGRRMPASASRRRWRARWRRPRPRTAWALGRLTRRVDGRLRIVGDPPLIVPIEDLATDGGGGDRGLRQVATDAQPARSPAGAGRSSSAYPWGMWPTRWWGRGVGSQLPGS